VQIISIQHYEDKIKMLKNEIKRFHNEREKEIKNIKKSALNYAILYFKNRSD
jgi:uncharacterized small protein (DUF1192 family)